MMYATIDATGIHTPTYNDVLEELKESYRTIYGEDVYLEADSQDGQFVAVLALAIKDANDMAVMTYNAFSPTTAVGNGLSSVVKVNGIRRLIASYSTVAVTLIGQSGTAIANGMVADSISNLNWLLPASVLIPPNGEITVTATAQSPGAIYVSIGTVDRILTPVPGWQTVTNSVASIPGAPIEIDADLRRRQSRSTANPAETVRESIYAGVANIVGVQRLRVYENWTGAPDENGIPGHSIAVVAEGGDVLEIATSIAHRKPPGTGTYGDIIQTIVDSHGVPNTINFFAMIETRVKVLVFISSMNGYISSTADLIKTSVAYWLNNQEVGTDSYYSRLIPPLELSGTSAMEATGRTQEDLNEISKTFVAIAVAQAVPEMIVVGGPYTPGLTALGMLALNNISKGDTCYLTLDDGTFWKVVISSVIDNIIFFDDYPIPMLRNVPDGVLVYLSDNLKIDFRAATIAQVTDITVVIGESGGSAPPPPPPPIDGGGGGSDTGIVITVTGSQELTTGFHGTVLVQQTGPVSITLPPSPFFGQAITIKDATGVANLYPINIIGVVEGRTNMAINYAYSWVGLVYSGSQWVQV